MEQESKKIFFSKRTFWIFAIILFLGFLFLIPPQNNNFPKTITVERGDTVSSISKHLYEEKIIRSEAIFKALVISSGGEYAIVQGDYLFDKPLFIWDVAKRFAKTLFGIERITITIPEGYTRTQIKETIEKVLPNFDGELFMQKTQNLEGYLFPDTYKFFPSANENTVIETMSNNFENKTKILVENAKQKGITKSDLVIMASIIEREANGKNDSPIISGILWERIRIGQRLQVDAPFFFLFGKESSELTRADLAIDSPYNTYRYKGLPPGPIGNPGLRAIEASLYSEKTNYLFYLHDSFGVAHYAVTYKDHLANKRKYIDNR